MTTKTLTALLTTCRESKILIACAESCTGGLLATTLTDASGASDIFDRGYICYSNPSKSEMLDVPPALIWEHGAVSGEVAQSLALGVIGRSRAQIAISITGLAGPNGASDDKPIGTVFFATARMSANGPVVKTEQHHFSGDRQHIRQATVNTALEILLKLAQTHINEA